MASYSKDNIYTYYKIAAGIIVQEWVDISTTNGILNAKINEAGTHYILKFETHCVPVSLVQSNETKLTHAGVLTEIATGWG